MIPNGASLVFNDVANFTKTSSGLNDIQGNPIPSFRSQAWILSMYSFSRKGRFWWEIWKKSILKSHQTSLKNKTEEMNITLTGQYSRVAGHSHQEKLQMGWGGEWLGGLQTYSCFPPPGHQRTWCFYRWYLLWGKTSGAPVEKYYIYNFQEVRPDHPGALFRPNFSA